MSDKMLSVGRKQIELDVEYVKVWNFSVPNPKKGKFQKYTSKHILHLNLITNINKPLSLNNFLHEKVKEIIEKMLKGSDEGSDVRHFKIIEIKNVNVTRLAKKVEKTQEETKELKPLKVLIGKIIDKRLKDSLIDSKVSHFNIFEINKNVKVTRLAK